MSAGLSTTTGRSASRTIVKWALILVGVGLLTAFPLLDAEVPVVLPGPMSSPGSLQVLAVALIFAGVAVSFDIVFGYAGLLSFGHAVFFGLGLYGTNLLMIAGTPFAAATTIMAVICTTASLVIGAIALRLRGIAFAMVTLAFVEVLWVILTVDPFHITGGDEGLALATSGVPEILRGVRNTSNLYWLALVYLIVVYVIAKRVTTSSAGLVWEAIRENEHRVEMLGFRAYPAKLLAFTIGGAIAGLGGSLYLLVSRGANPASASIDFSLALLLMVILGGSGRLWGAAIGGAIYGILTLRLPALSTSGVLDGLPETLRRVISEPLFVLGVIFILVILLLPTGIAGGIDRARSILGKALDIRRGPSNRVNDESGGPTDV